MFDKPCIEVIIEAPSPVKPELITDGSYVVVPSLKLIYTELGPVGPIASISFKVQLITYGVPVIPEPGSITNVLIPVYPAR